MAGNKVWKRIDWWLLIVMVILQILGLLTLASATHSSGIMKLMRQVMWMFVGWIAFLIVLNLDYHLWARWAGGIYWLNLVLLIFVLLFGYEQYGAQRWLKFSGFTIQPSEFAKAAIIITLASFIVENKERLAADFRLFLKAGFHVCLPLVLVFLQPDLGTSLVLVGIWLGMMFFAKVPFRWLVATIFLGLTLFVIGWQKGIIKDYQKQRLIAFIDPYSKSNKEGYHIIQSQLAIGSGGLKGKGWFNGQMGKLGFVPAQPTDFIFTVVGEEGGFITSSLTVVLFAILLWRILAIMLQTDDPFAISLLAGIFCFFFSHTTINIGMTLRLMPITGLPLPFFSVGGSNLLVCYFLLGVFQNVAINRKRFSFR